MKLSLLQNALWQFNPNRPPEHVLTSTNNINNEHTDCAALMLIFFLKLLLDIQPRKSCNNKYMIAPTQITKMEIFAFIAVLVF